MNNNMFLRASLLLFSLFLISCGDDEAAKKAAKISMQNLAMQECVMDLGEGNCTVEYINKILSPEDKLTEAEGRQKGLLVEADLEKERKVKAERLKRLKQTHSYAIECTDQGSKNIIIVDDVDRRYLTQVFRSTSAFDRETILLSETIDGRPHDIVLSELPNREFTLFLSDGPHSDLEYTYNTVDLSAESNHNFIFGVGNYRVSRNGDKVVHPVKGAGSITYNNCKIYKGDAMKKQLERAIKNYDKIHEVWQGKYDAVEKAKQKRLDSRKI